MIAYLVAGLSLLLQTTPSKLVGNIAEQLMASDIQVIERSLPSGFGNSSLIFGLHRGSSRDYFDVYGPPTSSASDLHRGRLARFFWSPGLRGQTLDKVVPTELNYAQVAAPNRGFDVTDIKDLNRPFEVIGTIDDTELRNIVALLRSQPYVPSIRRAVPVCPILSIMKTEGTDSAVARLDPATQPLPGNIARVIVTRTNGVWFVSQVVIGQA
jgi:hypothetical protein